MSDLLAGGITSDVPVQRDFKNAALGAAPAPMPVMSFRVKPEAIPGIVSNLGDLKGRTNDSEIIQQGQKYSFMDKRNNQPLAELDTANGMVTMYKSPESMATRIDSAFVSAKDIKDFIKENTAEPAPQVRFANNGPN